MSQHDFDIANQTASNARADLNNALKALASLSSGASAPSTTYANMLWYDTSANILKMRAEADDAWINIGYLDQSADAFRIFDDTQVVNTSGTQTGLIGDQSTATWETGTGTTESLVSPAKVKAAIDTLALTVGVGQTWQDVSGSRSVNVSYQNTTGKPIMWATNGSSNNQVQISANGTSWVTVGYLGQPGDWNSNVSAIIPDDHYYRISGSATNPFDSWSELR